MSDQPPEPPPASPPEQPPEQSPEQEEPQRPAVPDLRSRDADADQTVVDEAEQLFSGGDQPCDGESTREMLAAVYVRPRGYETARQALRTGCVLVLAGGPGSGKETMARALLYEVGAEDIEEIDPFIEPKALLDRQFVGPRGDLVDSHDEEQARRLRPFTCAR
jgi:hypothetical protein